jgi:HSP20 family protein
MIRWSPGTELANLHGQMDRLFEGFFGASTSGGSQGEMQRPLPTYYLPLDVKEVENGYEITTPVPGFSPEEVEVTFSEGVLKISAERAQQSSQEQGGYLRREVAFGNYQRAIQLPGDVKEDEISATFENGMLTVMVPKVPRPQPKRIQVTPGSKQKQLTGTAS